MSETVENAINEINQYISMIISDMINARKKLLEAYQKMLDKINALMEERTYSYRLGEALGKALKIEGIGILHSDVAKPSLQLSYTGPKTTLSYDTSTIDVPSVPVFMWEPVYPDKVSHETVLETIRRSMSIKFPAGKDIAETPDMENIYAKYYSLEYNSWSVTPTTITLYSGTPIVVGNFVIAFGEFKVFKAHNYTRQLTVEGTSYMFIVSLNIGQLKGTIVSPSDAQGQELEIPGLFIEMMAEYTGDDVAFVVFGREFTPKNVMDSMKGVDALCLLWQGRAYMWEMPSL